MKKFLSVLLAVMMVLSTVSFAVPTAVGSFDAAVEAPAAEFVPEEAELAADSDYGTLLFDLDFETEEFTGGTLGGSGNIKYYSSKEQPELPEGFDAYYALTGNTIECAYTDTDGYEINFTNVLKVHANSDPSYPHIAVSALKDSATWDKDFPGFPDGTYTIVVDAAYDYNATKPAVIQARFADTGSFGGGSAIGEQWTMNYAENALDNYVISWDVINQEDGTTKVIAANGAEKEYATLKSMGLYFGQMGNSPDYIYVDNFQMYWKPGAVNVEIKNNGETVKTISVPSNGILVSDLIKEAGIGAEYVVTSVKVNGEAKLLSDTVVLGADSVVEITSEQIDLSAYEDAEKGKLLFNVTFEDYEEGYAFDTVMKAEGMLSASYKTPYADALMSHDLTDWCVAVGNGATYTVMKDPKNPDNLVAGQTEITSTGYPHIRIDTNRDTATAMYGFVEEDGGVYTVEYDLMDVKGELNTTDRFGGRSSIADPAWGEREDVPAESAGAKVAGEYRTNSSVYSDEKLVNMGSTAEVSFIKIHAKAPVANTYYIDNIRVWWKPGKADITVKSVGAPLADVVLNDVKTTGISASELIALIDTSSISGTKYTVKGISLSEDGELVDNLAFAGDTTVYLVWQEIDMSEWMDKDGTVLFDIDFDDLANGTQLKNTDKASTLGRVNPYIAGSDSWYLNLSGYDNLVIEDGALKAEKTGTGKWPQIQISAGSGKSMINDGIIYVTADMKLGLDASQTTNVTLGLTSYVRKWDGTKWDGSTNNQNSFGQISTVENNKWYTISNTAVLEGKEYNGVECIIFIPTYAAGSSLVDYFYLDNLKLCYRPYNVNVTLVSDDSNLILPETFKASTTGITVSELVKDVESTSFYYKVTGVKIGGVEYGLTDTVVLTSDCEIEVLAAEDTEYAKNLGGQ